MYKKKKKKKKKERAWNWICEKRDECDLTLSKMSEVCFFFSAISTSKLDSKKKTSKGSQPDEARESDDSNEESQINPSQISSQGKNIFPAISYWLACQTQNGSAVNPFKIQRALVKCGLEFYLSRASRKKSSHDLNQLCQVLKDHKNPCLMSFVEASYQHCLRWVINLALCHLVISWLILMTIAYFLVFRKQLNRQFHCLTIFPEVLRHDQFR